MTNIGMSVKTIMMQISPLFLSPSSHWYSKELKEEEKVWVALTSLLIMVVLQPRKEEEGEDGGKNRLTLEAPDEILDEAGEEAFDLSDAGGELFVALTLQVEPGTVDVVGESVSKAPGVRVHHRVGQGQSALDREKKTLKNECRRYTYKSLFAINEK